MITNNGPFVLQSDKVVFCDIDDTIVKWNPTQEEINTKGVAFNNYGWQVMLVPHYAHIEQIKRHKAIGHKVIFWSAGGWEWANEVIKTLELTEYADAIMSKPSWFIDDLPASAFMPEHNRIYKEDV